MTLRSTASLALASLLLVGCGTETSVPAADDPEPTPSPSPSTSLTPSPSSPEPSSTVRPLEHFPLARGYPETNGDDGSPVVVTGKSGVEDLTFCGRPAWSPEVLIRPVDLVGTTYNGEAEDYRGRTLVRYGDEGLAAQALAMLRLAVEKCPEEEADGTAQVYTGTDRATGNEVFTITQRYRGEYGFDTGLEVIDAVRVGDLLLLNWDYGEGGGSGETIKLSQRALTDQSDDLLPEMCEYAVPACRVREPAPRPSRGG